MSKDCDGTQIGDGMIAFAVAFALIGYFYLFSGDKSETVQMAKNGLEECSRTLNSSSDDTIWVKDCKTHMLTLQSIHKEQLNTK